MTLKKIIITLIFIILTIFPNILLLFVPFHKEKAIKNVRCSCKYNGPYGGKIIDKENNEPIKNGLIICWWDLKRKALSKEVFYETIKIYKTYTDEEGNFYIPKYPEKKDKYICCPKGVIYNEEYLNFINFSLKLDCFKKKEGCTMYLKKLSEEEKAEILKIIPADARQILRESVHPNEK